MCRKIVYIIFFFSADVEGLKMENDPKIKKSHHFREEGGGDALAKFICLGLNG